MFENGSGDSGPKGTKLPFAGMLPDNPAPPVRPSSPPPIPPEAKRPSVAPPPRPRDLEQEAARLREVMEHIWEDESRIRQNGNSRPASVMFVKRAKDDVLIELAGETRLLRIFPTRYLAAAAVLVALGAGGLALHSCNEKKALEQKVEEQQKEIKQIKEELKKTRIQKSPKTSNYIPKKLRYPPQKPKLKILRPLPSRRRA